MPCRIRTLAGADGAALTAEAVACLVEGGLCALPTETVYGLAALPTRADARARLAALVDRDAGSFTLHLAEPDDLRRLAARPTPQARRLMQRYWPGPLTLLLPHGDDHGTVGVRVPAHDFTRAVIRAVGEPLWLVPAARGAATPLLEPAAIAAAFGDDLTLVVDDGPSPLGTPSTIVRATGPVLAIEREGILGRADVLDTAAEHVLFVCTGNTCRSPMAEALARVATAKALGVPPDEVLAHGYAFHSAGVSTMPGMPASEGSLLAANELGIDLGAHRSQPLTHELLRRAARVFCLGQSHRRAILAEAPEQADKVAVLRPDGLDIADPYGGDLRVYRRARDEILAAVTARMGNWLGG